MAGWLTSGGRLVTAMVTGSAWVLIGTAALGGCTVQTSKAGGHEPPPTMTLRLVNTRGATEAAPYLQEVARLSSRTLDLSGPEKFEKRSVYAEADALRAVRNGHADVGIIPARAFHAAGVTDFDALIAPMEVDNMALQAAVLRSDIATHMVADVGRIGLVGVGLLPGPMRHPVGISHDLFRPADFRGATIGVSPSVVAEHSVHALGADPVASPFEGAHVSGFDGIEIQADAVEQYETVVRSITRNVDLWPRPLVVVANSQRWERLSDQQKQWLTSAIAAAQPATLAVQRAVAEVANVCRAGGVRLIEASAADLIALRTEFDPVYAWLRRDSLTSGYLDDIDTMKARMRAAPDELPTCADLTGDQSSTSPPTPTARTASPVDGDYVMTLTDADIAAAGDTRDTAVPENYGEFRLVFDHGRFIFNQRDPPACTWAYGDFAVDGDRVILSITRGGGVAPDNAENKPGELFEYKWNIYRGRLTWSPVPGAVSPAGWTAEPWVRQPTRPPRAFLHQECLPPDAAFQH